MAGMWNGEPLWLWYPPVVAPPVIHSVGKWIEVSSREFTESENNIVHEFLAYKLCRKVQKSTHESSFTVWKKAKGLQFLI